MAEKTKDQLAADLEKEQTAHKATTERAEQAEAAAKQAGTLADLAETAAKQATERAKQAEADLQEANDLIEQLQGENTKLAKENAALRGGKPGQKTIEVDGDLYRIRTPKINIDGAVVDAKDLTQEQARKLLKKNSGALAKVEAE